MKALKLSNSSIVQAGFDAIEPPTNLGILEES